MVVPGLFCGRLMIVPLVLWLSRGCFVIAQWLSRGCPVGVPWVSRGCSTIGARLGPRRDCPTIDQ
eukprot:6780853-Pyramimonas_sp.AAC.1